MTLFGRKTQSEGTAPDIAHPPESALGRGAVRLQPQRKTNIEVAGESYHRKEVAAMFRGWGLTEGGVKMCHAILVEEPTNKYDRNAVKVMIDRHHVGYVPAENAGPMSRALRSLKRGEYGYCEARAWGTNEDGVWRARVTLVFDGSAEPEADYAAERRVREAHAAETARLRAERDAVKAHRESARALSSVDGTHWANYKPAIAELKKQGQLADALSLLLRCAAAAEAEARALGSAPDVWPTWQLCMLYEKSGDRAAAVEALDRFKAACGDEPVPDKIVQWQLKMRVTGAPVAQSANISTEPVIPEPGLVAPEPGTPEDAAPELPPANWYPDPYGTPGLLRYWDGVRWTEYTHAQG